MKAEILTTEYEKGHVVRHQNTVLFHPEEENQEINVINLYPEVKYQEITGFGGAVTEAAADVLDQMEETEREEILQAYYGRDGMGYSFIRTPIDSCDFSRTQYCAYHKSAASGLDKKELNRNAGTILKYITRIQEMAGRRIQVMLTPWSPPIEMKTNGKREGGGKLREEYYETWAEYICAYTREYREKGIPVTMLSIQNEPNAAQTWDSCLFTAAEEKKFLAEALYPAIRRNQLEDLEIYVWDHNKERAYERIRDMMDPESSKMIDGVAFHWYSGDHFEGLQLIREQYPDKKLLFSEGCIEYSRFDHDNQLKNARLYAHDMIGNFNAGMNTFIDWNLVLDQEGGPNYAGNLCESPIMCNTEYSTYTKKLSFCYLEHFCRYIKPGARRIAHTSYDNHIDVLSVQNPEGDLTAVLYNGEKEEKKFYMRLKGFIAECAVPANGIVTVRISAE